MRHDDVLEHRAAPNALLRNVMLNRGLSKARPAAATGIDERTIQRWRDGQVSPHADNARQMADALGCEPADLWPDKYAAPASQHPGTVAATVFASRAHIPVRVWLDLFAGARERIDICVYGGTFLFDTVPGFGRLLREALGRGVLVRFVVGDPSADSVILRGEEEEIGSSLSSRCALTLDRLRPVASESGIEIRLQATTLYASLFRVDETLIANHHIYGSPASDNPAIMLGSAAGPDLWATYADSFEAIWASARPARLSEGNP